MAKRAGLGRGVADVFSSEPVEEKPVETYESTSGEKIETTENAPKEEKNNTLKLPKGVSSDENGTLWVDPALLKPNPHQPRQYFDQAKLDELTESVRREGVLSPIIIEEAGDGSFYIIAGERRTRAAKAAGLNRVPVQIRAYSDSRKLEVALVENIQRTDLNPVEEAQAYFQLMQMEGITQDQVAQRVGKSRSAVANSVRLLKLPEDMLNSLAEGTLSAGHAKALLSVTSASDQRVLYGRIMGQGLSVRQCEMQAQELNNGSHSKSVKKDSDHIDKRDPNYIDLETRIRDTLGTKVLLKGDFERGNITIEYFSKEDLDRIFNIITGSV